jgi:hypothetical protein
MPEEIGEELFTEGMSEASWAAATEAANAIANETVALLSEAGSEVVSEGVQAAADTTSNVIGGGAGDVAAETAKSNTEEMIEAIQRNATDTGSADRAFVAGSSVEPSKGIVGGGLLEFANKNPALTVAGGTGLAGALGGVGRAALQKEMDERAFNSRMGLRTHDTNEQQRGSTMGTLKNPQVAKASGAKVLYTSDGKPVYVNGGIVGGQLV